MSRWGRFACLMTQHRWAKHIEEVPPTALFFRIDCLRCGYAIDAAPLRRLYDERPDFYKWLGKSMP